jgi:hypothetical protein
MQGAWREKFKIGNVLRSRRREGIWDQDSGAWCRDGWMDGVVENGHEKTMTFSNLVLFCFVWFGLVLVLG